MGFGSLLTKIGLGAADLFTGGMASKIGNPLLDGLSGISAVTGKASGAAQSQKNIDSRNQLDWEKLKLDAPGARAKTSLGAAMAKNYTPQTINWKGPGSGLRGEIPTYSGGSKAAMSASIQDPIVRQMLDDAMAGKAPASYDEMEHPKSSLGDKLLGGTSLISSLLGGILPGIIKAKGGGGGGGGGGDNWWDVGVG